MWCFATTFIQAQKLLAISYLSSDRKKEACDKLDIMERQIGSVGVTKLMECGGDYPAALQQVTAVCGSLSLNSGSCEIASQPDNNEHRSLFASENDHASEDKNNCDAVCTAAKAQV